VLRISDVSSISFASHKLYDNSFSIGTKEHELSARSLSNQIKESLLSANYSCSSQEMMKRIEDAIEFKDDVASSEKLKNAHDFMVSKEMRYGLGPEQNSVNRISTNSNAMHDNSRDDSANSFRSSASKQTLGNFLPLDFKVKLCYECCSGIAYLHSKGFVHNDVKSLNFLVSRDLTVKLSDLGETRLTNSEISAEDIPTSVNWSAPELLCGTDSVHTAADVWGLALVCIEILTGAIPFDTPEYRTMQLKAFAQKLKEGLRPEIPKEIRESKYKWLCDLIELAWVYEPSKRCSAEYMVKEFQKQLKNNN
jgi:serine/threonine protein kinase